MNLLHDYKKDIFDLNEVNEFALDDPKGLIKVSEELYHEQIRTVVDKLLINKKNKIVLLAGPSSSGKTTTSNLICANLANRGYDALVVSLDDFYLDLETRPKLPNGEYDLENVTALDLDYLNTFVNSMFEKGEALMPEYDFKTGTRKKEYKKIQLNKNTIVIMEGIHALNPILFKSHTDAMFKIYICANTNFNTDNDVVIPAEKVRLMRRLIRDFLNRGASLDRTFKMWHNVLEGENIYIKPFKNTADFLINSTHAYEPLMYADKLLPMLKKENDEQAIPLINMLEKCEKLSPKLLPDNSLLHEFLD